MRRAAVISVLILAGSAAAMAAEVRSSLRPAARQRQGAFPYRTADLTVENRSGVIVRMATLRWRRGGPRRLVNLTIAPNGSQVVRVNLPAASPRQTYDLRFFAADSAEAAPWDSLPAMAELEAEMTWPVEWVTDEAFVDPAAYEPYRDALLSWPVSLRQYVLLGAAMMSLAAAATLLIRRPIVRLAATAVVAVLAALASLLLIDRQQVVVERAGPAPWPHAGAALRADELLSVQSRRTVRWRSAGDDWAPIYRSGRDMAGETMTIGGGRGVSATIHPDRVRLFRVRRAAAFEAGGAGG